MREAKREVERDRKEGERERGNKGERLRDERQRGTEREGDKGGKTQRKVMKRERERGR